MAARLGPLFPPKNYNRNWTQPGRNSLDFCVPHIIDLSIWECAPAREARRAGGT